MKRALPFAALLVALLVTAWWGVSTVLFPASATDVEHDGPIVLRPTSSDATANAQDGAPPRLAGVPGGAALPTATAGVTGTTPPAAKGSEGDDEPGPSADPAGGAPELEETVEDGGWGDGGGRSAGITTLSGSRANRVGNQGVTPPDVEGWVPEGYAWIGTPQRQVDGMLGARDDGSLQGLAYEAPRHAVTMGAFWIERYEVSNQRWRDFLRETAEIRFETWLGDARTLVETVTVLVGARAPDRWDVEATARQLYRANQAALHAALPGLVVVDPVTRNLDEEATWEAFLDARLPRGITLRFYDRAPPRTWPDASFEAGRAGYPVRDLSLLDATAFALWAGKHVPSETEWEYATRSPSGWDEPWGAKPLDFDVVVNGGQTYATGETPATWPVNVGQDSASWVGCQQVLGNVAEWTSSFLDPYPESGLRPLRIPVDRGGSAFDEDPLAVRPAFRGWTAAELELDGSLDPEARRLWTGLRLARYEEVARSVTVAMHTAVRVGARLPATALEPRVYAGVQGWLDRVAFPDRQDPTVRPGTKSIVVQPLPVVHWAPGGSLPLVIGVPDPVISTATLLELGAQRAVFLGLLHTDLQALDVFVSRDEGSIAPSGDPRLARGVLPPGTWVLALVQGYVVAAAPDLSFVGYLTRRPVGKATVSVLERTPGPSGRVEPAAALDFQSRTGRAVLELLMPLGNALEPDLAVRLVLPLRFEFQVTQAVRDWQEGHLTSDER